MNSLARSVLNLASYDEAADDISLPNVMRQCLQLLAVFPMLAVYGYHAYNYKSGSSLYIHAPNPEHSTAENILALLRPDSSYSYWEAHVLDICLMLHAEHGGGITPPLPPMWSPPPVRIPIPAWRRRWPL